MRSYTDTEFESLLHVILTSDVGWDPQAMDFDVEDDENWYDATSDNVDQSVLFDEFGNCKGRKPDLEISSADTWYDTLTLDQHARNEVVEATFVCAQYAHRVHHFDNDDFKKAVLLVNDTEIIDAPNLTEDDDNDNIVPHVVPPDKVVDDNAPNLINNNADVVPPDKDVGDDIKDAPRTFKVKDPEYEKLRPLFGWQDAKTIL